MRRDVRGGARASSPLSPASCRGGRWARFGKCGPFPRAVVVYSAGCRIQRAGSPRSPAAVFSAACADGFSRPCVPVILWMRCLVWNRQLLCWKAGLFIPILVPRTGTTIGMTGTTIGISGVRIGMQGLVIGIAGSFLGITGTVIEMTIIVIGAAGIAFGMTGTVIGIKRFIGGNSGVMKNISRVGEDFACGRA